MASLEGTRPLLLELQALVASASFGTPRRTVLGADYNRVCLLLAVLEKRGGVPLGNQDVFVNVAGGGRVTEPAADLGIVIAAASSYMERPVRGDVLVVGEVGLTGEVRAVTAIETRLREGAALGFQRAVVPASNLIDPPPLPLEVEGVATVTEALEMLAAMRRRGATAERGRRHPRRRQRHAHGRAAAQAVPDDPGRANPRHDVRRFAGHPAVMTWWSSPPPRAICDVRAARFARLARAGRPSASSRAVPSDRSPSGGVCRRFPRLREIVLVHDAVRPFVTRALIDAVLRAAVETGAAVCARPIAETVKRVEDGLVRQTLDRRGLWAVQTPQGFRAALLREAHDKARRDGVVGHRRRDARGAPRATRPRGRPDSPQNVRSPPPKISIVDARARQATAQASLRNDANLGATRKPPNSDTMTHAHLEQATHAASRPPNLRYNDATRAWNRPPTPQADLPTSDTMTPRAPGTGHPRRKPTSQPPIQ